MAIIFVRKPKIIPLTFGNSKVIPMTVDENNITPMMAEDGYWVELKNNNEVENKRGYYPYKKENK